MRDDRRRDMRNYSRGTRRDMGVVCQECGYRPADRFNGRWLCSDKDCMEKAAKRLIRG
jgi:hypothetical protein